LANIYLARLDRTLDAEGVSYVRYADDVRLASRTPAGTRHALTRTAEVLEGLGLRLNPQKTKLVSLHQGVDFLGYRLIRQKGHLNVYITPAVVERCRAQVRQLTRRTAGVSLPVLVARLNEYLRGWGEYFKRAQCSGVLDRLDKWGGASGASLPGKALAQYSLAPVSGPVPVRHTWADLSLRAASGLSP